jgi:hypothetical protein
MIALRTEKPMAEVPRHATTQASQEATVLVARRLADRPARCAVPCDGLWLCGATQEASPPRTPGLA